MDRTSACLQQIFVCRVPHQGMFKEISCVGRAAPPKNAGACPRPHGPCNFPVTNIRNTNSPHWRAWLCAQARMISSRGRALKVVTIPTMQLPADLHCKLCSVPGTANKQPGATGGSRVMAKRIRARVTKTRKVYVHNDISQAATTFNNATQEKAKGDRTGVGYYGMATAVLTAFAFEAKLNFMGAQLVKAKKIPEWNEYES
jgi:hypothetical protein